MERRGPGARGRVQDLISIGDYALSFNQSSRPSLRQLLAFRFHLMMNTPLAGPVLTRLRRPLFRSLRRSWSLRDPAFGAAEAHLAEGPPITVPTTVIRATQDGRDVYDPQRPNASPQFRHLVATLTVDAGNTPDPEQPDVIARMIDEAMKRHDQ